MQKWEINDFEKTFSEIVILACKFLFISYIEFKMLKMN